MTHTPLFIAGKWTPGISGATHTVIDPATEEPDGKVALAGAADLDAALAGAATGFEIWRRTSPVERGRVLRKTAELLMSRVDEIAPVLTRQQGKTLFEARFEVIVSCDILEWFAEEARRAYGRIIPPRSDGFQQLVLRKPIGPVVGFVPWNFGLGQAARKVGAALAAGCSIILKGPEETPESCAVLVRALLDAGLPPSVVNLVFGVPAQISAHLIRHRIIRKISFTGSTAVGKHLAEMAGLHMKRITMELGGHSPVIVARDAAVEQVAKLLVASKYRNVGQACISPTRFLIHTDVYDRFVDSFVRHAGELKTGDGLDPQTTMGPLSNARRLTAMQGLVADAVERGARVLLGGKRIGNRGFYFEPTVIADVPLDARMMNEEPFGPIAIMRPYGDLDEALAEANRLDYGLFAYAFTASAKDAARIAVSVESGMVAINNMDRAFPEVPYGGVKDSGYGSEGGSEALDAYLTVKYVSRTAA